MGLFRLISSGAGTSQSLFHSLYMSLCAGVMFLGVRTSGLLYRLQGSLATLFTGHKKVIANREDDCC